MSLVAIGLRDFIPLKEGEFDQRSSGGAYIHGSQFGQLTVAAGPQTFVVDKSRSEIASRSDLFKFYHGGPLMDNTLTTFLDNTQMRLGDVKRQILPIDFTDKPAPPGLVLLDLGREFTVHVDQPLKVSNLAATGLVYDLRVGSIWPDGPLGLTPIPSTNVFQERLTKAAIDLYTFNVSSLGEVTTTAAASYQLSSGLGGTSLLSAGNVTIDGTLISLGSTAIHQAVKGDVLVFLLQSLVTQLSPIVTSLTGSALAGILTASLNAVGALPALAKAGDLLSTKNLLE